MIYMDRKQILDIMKKKGAKAVFVKNFIHI